MTSGDTRTTDDKIVCTACSRKQIQQDEMSFICGRVYDYDVLTDSGCQAFLYKLIEHLLVNENSFGFFACLSLILQQYIVLQIKIFLHFYE